MARRPALGQVRVELPETRPRGGFPRHHDGAQRHRPIRAARRYRHRHDAHRLCHRAARERAAGGQRHRRHFRGRPRARAAEITARARPGNPAAGRRRAPDRVPHGRAFGAGGPVPRRRAAGADAHAAGHLPRAGAGLCQLDAPAGGDGGDPLRPRRRDLGACAMGRAAVDVLGGGAAGDDRHHHQRFHRAGHRHRRPRAGRGLVPRSSRARRTGCARWC